MKYSLVNRLLRRNTSPARIAGFIISNFIGLAIVAGALQFYSDARSFWEEDSVVRKGYIVVNKVVTSANTLGSASSDFTSGEISDLEAQPWARRVGAFRKADFHVNASVDMGAAGNGAGGRGALSTAMFLESVPDDFMDVNVSGWEWSPSAEEVPLVISKDYLALYNFGFAASTGMPKLSGATVSGLPLTLRLSGDDGRQVVVHARVAGYSTRFNTILVPSSFIEYMNGYFNGTARKGCSSPGRLIVDVSSPGDTRIGEYLSARGMETAGDGKASQASYLLKVVVGLVTCVGGLICVLSLFILMLSISLLMEKNRQKLHSLLMLGYAPGVVARPYINIIAVACSGAAVMAIGGILLLRMFYLPPLEAMGASPAHFPVTVPVVCGMAAIIITVNNVAVKRRVRSAFR